MIQWGSWSVTDLFAPSRRSLARTCVRKTFSKKDWEKIMYKDTTSSWLVVPTSTRAFKKNVMQIWSEVIQTAKVFEILVPSIHKKKN